jgi:GLPGLI family protein
MKKKNFLPFSPVLILSLILVSCESLITTEKISEGVIEFDVTYPKASKDDLMASLMPETMKYKFKNNNINSEMKAGMGMFTNVFIINHQKKSLAQLVKIMNKKMSLEITEAEVNKMKSEEEKFKIEFVDEKKEIAGYKCKKVIITSVSNPSDSFTAYYTDDIKIESPNWSTPYDQIKGVLLEYQITRYNVCMRFTAKTVSKTPVDDADFVIPEGYETVPKEEIDKIFENF